jgi:phosphate/phosphite/phosphonate ABC transporter binding protein
VYLNLYRPFTEHLTKCIGRRVIYYPVQSNSAQIEAMRSGRLHIAGFSTGPTGFAVNLAGAVPFFHQGNRVRAAGLSLIALVRSNSPYQKLSDLKGKRVAHTSPSSNSGNLAPRVLFPAQGLTPDVDYRPLMSGGHDKSALGVVSGDYDMAPVASDVFNRMVVRGTIRDSELRTIYTSPLFPTSSFSYAARSHAGPAKQDQGMFFNFRFTPEMVKEFDGNDRFFRSTISNTGRWYARSRRLPARRSTRQLTRRNPGARPRRAPRPSKTPSSNTVRAQHGRPDTGHECCGRSQGPAPAHHQPVVQGVPGGTAGACATSRSRSPAAG